MRFKFMVLCLMFMQQDQSRQNQVFGNVILISLMFSVNIYYTVTKHGIKLDNLSKIKGLGAIYMLQVNEKDVSNSIKLIKIVCVKISLGHRQSIVCKKAMASI